MATNVGAFKTMIENKQKLQNLCKSLATLDAILCDDWEYRYYSYNNKWSVNEECFTMRDGEGDELLILFKENKCIINGFLKEKGMLDLNQLKNRLPKDFHDFIYGEPVKSIGTSFCMWTDDSGTWNSTDFINLDEEMEDFLDIYKNEPAKYQEWALDYYELDTLNYEGIEKVYKHTPLTIDLVNCLNPEITDFEELNNELSDIGYPSNLNMNK